MAKVLILGSTGMLGSMVSLYFKRKTHHTVHLSHRGADDNERNVWHFNAEQPTELHDLLESCRPEYLINCIGIIKPHCKDDDPEGVQRAIKVNAMFPHLLEKECSVWNVRVIQIATDCVFSGNTGAYHEDSPHDALDVYGKTKSLGEVQKGNFLNIRCSIIGPERVSKLSLLEWVLDQKDGARVNGFTHHKWNGLTTLQFAQVCDQIIIGCEFDELVSIDHNYHCILNETVNKHILVDLIASEFKKPLSLIPTDSIGSAIDRSLISKREDWRYSSPICRMADAIHELHDFIQTADYYHER
jgi:dTDP-4-dehydrorhamnose reductase